MFFKGFKKKPSSSPITNSDTNNIHEKYKDNKHIFIFSALGRSSSTALQRIINSSNEIIIWGEPWYILHTLRYFERYCQIRDTINSNKNIQRDFEALSSENHKEFYPNAYKKIDYLEPQIANLVTSACATEELKNLEFSRFGFKNIHIDTQVIQACQLLYNNCEIILQFRNPLDQWKSIQRLQYNWQYSKSVDLYIERYQKELKNIFELSKNHPSSITVLENTQLYDINIVDRLFKKLELKKYDKSLIKDQIHKNKPANDELSSQLNKIQDSEAFEIYQKASSILSFK